MTEFHSVKSFIREEPRVELIESMLKSILDVVELEFDGQPVRVDGFRPRNIDDWRTVRETSLEQNLGSLSKIAGGYNWGGGVTYSLGRWHHAKVYGEFRYHKAYQSDVETVVWPLTVGLRW